MDDESLKAELDELEQEQLDERLAGAQSVPAHSPPSAVKADSGGFEPLSLPMSTKMFVLMRLGRSGIGRKESARARRGRGVAPTAGSARHVDASHFMVATPCALGGCMPFCVYSSIVPPPSSANPSDCTKVHQSICKQGGHTEGKKSCTMLSLLLKYCRLPRLSV